jgi:hypothetical protein
VPKTCCSLYLPPLLTVTPPVGSSLDFMVGQQVVILPARAAGWLWFKASSPRPCSHKDGAQVMQHPACRSRSY